MPFGTSGGLGAREDLKTHHPWGTLNGPAKSVVKKPVGGPRVTVAPAPKK